MVEALKNVSDDSVRAYIVWLPILGGDFEGEARKLSNSFRDKRVSYFLDPDTETGKLWQQTLGIPFVAWDVYFLYGPDAQWEKEPEKPAFWMHQLGLKIAPRLDGKVFTEKLREMAANLKASENTKPSGNMQPSGSMKPASNMKASENMKATENLKPTGGRAKVEFFYFKSCPSYKQALINLNAALKETGIKADVSTINVTSEARAEQVGFQGSPSIRVNGKDLDGRDQGYAYSCRIYQIDGKVTATPTKDFIEGKLRELTR